MNRFVFLAVVLASLVSGCANTMKRVSEEGITAFPSAVSDDAVAMKNNASLKACHVRWGAGLDKKKCDEISVLHGEATDDNFNPWKCISMQTEVSCSRPSLKGKGKVDLREFYRAK